MGLVVVWQLPQSTDEKLSVFFKLIFKEKSKKKQEKLIWLNEKVKI